MIDIYQEIVNIQNQARMRLSLQLYRQMVPHPANQMPKCSLSQTESLIGDKAYDSDPLDERLRERHGIEMIAPNRRKRKRTQDGRPLRRYIRRWRIERLFAWLKNFRRLTCRWERYATNFLAMLQLGCMLILLRHL